MKFLKHRLNQKQMVCFTVEELLGLMISKDLVSVLGIAVSYPLAEVQNEIADLASTSSNSRDDHEFWVCIFALYQEFERNCSFCFYLKDSFDRNKDTINSFEDLVTVKTDPPDIVINYDGGFYDFELKRYRGVVDGSNMLDFLEEKILKYSEPLNFYILLQPQNPKEISLDVFQDLSNKFKAKAGKNKVGRVCFSFNANNQHLLSVHIYPKYAVYKHPFVSGSEQTREILMKSRA